MSITISDINDAMLNRQADRIRELESKLSNRDAEIAELKRDIEACPKGWHHSEVVALEKERDQLREQVKMLQSAIKNLRDVKGRHHSEIAYKRLIEALTATEQNP